MIAKFSFINLQSWSGQYRPQILFSRLFVMLGELRLFKREKTIIESTMLTKLQYPLHHIFVLWTSTNDEANIVTHMWMSYFVRNCFDTHILTGIRKKKRDILKKQQARNGALCNSSTMFET